MIRTPEKQVLERIRQGGLITATEGTWTHTAFSSLEKPSFLPGPHSVPGYPDVVPEGKPGLEVSLQTIGIIFLLFQGTKIPAQKQGGLAERCGSPQGARIHAEPLRSCL